MQQKNLLMILNMENVKRSFNALSGLAVEQNIQSGTIQVRVMSNPYWFGWNVNRVTLES